MSSHDDDNDPGRSEKYGSFGESEKTREIEFEGDREGVWGKGIAADRSTEEILGNEDSDVKGVLGAVNNGREQDDDDEEERAYKDPPREVAGDTV